ncbi:DUF3429 domain-containing protein [Marinobacterium lutimaris]|uniref:DUF3429 domain-containing protein n=1 Tax=Marinobacterium lutimaris TaxID=568106 RepID=A0A1H5XET5_9GAMM|nr:DUF3429 domain-containing protein [Marinobacterium lutimaris]SEG09985.1 Protein of unknown function [Marinobacterium lutimaris]
MTPWHSRLGYAGLIPFIGLSALALQSFPGASYWLLTYAALILSFLGGLLWCASLNRQVPTHALFVSVGVMIWAWVWLLMPQFSWYLPGAITFVLLWLYERIYLSDAYPREFMRLREWLTGLAALSLFLAGSFATPGV